MDTRPMALAPLRHVPRQVRWLEQRLGRERALDPLSRTPVPSISCSAPGADAQGLRYSPMVLVSDKPFIFLEPFILIRYVCGVARPPTTLPRGEAGPPGDERRAVGGPWRVSPPCAMKAMSRCAPAPHPPRRTSGPARSSPGPAGPRSQAWASGRALGGGRAPPGPGSPACPRGRGSCVSSRPLTTGRRPLAAPTVLRRPRHAGHRGVLHPRRAGRSPPPSGRQGLSKPRGSVGGQRGLLRKPWGGERGGAGATATVAENTLQGLIQQGEAPRSVLRDPGCQAAAGAPSHLKRWQRGARVEDGRLVETGRSMLTLVGQVKKVRPRGGADCRARLACTRAAFNGRLQWPGSRPHASGFVPRLDCCIESVKDQCRCLVCQRLTPLVTTVDGLDP